MSSIDYLNGFLNSSLPFPLYQRLNPLFNGISNKDAPLSSGRSILARGSRGPGPGPWAQRAKMLRPIDKGVSLLDIPLNNGFNR